MATRLAKWMAIATVRIVAFPSPADLTGQAAVDSDLDGMAKAETGARRDRDALLRRGPNRCMMHGRAAARRGPAGRRARAARTAP